jgi:hypothetical protein
VARSGDLGLERPPQPLLKIGCQGPFHWPGLPKLPSGAGAGPCFSGDEGGSGHRPLGPSVGGGNRRYRPSRPPRAFGREDGWPAGVLSHWHGSGASAFRAKREVVLRGWAAQVDGRSSATEKGGRRWAFRAGGCDPAGASCGKVARRRNAATLFLGRGWGERWFGGKGWQCLVFGGIAWQDLCVSHLTRKPSSAPDSARSGAAPGWCPLALR